MAIDFKHPEPLYIQIANDLKAKIESGELQPEQQVASQQVLSEQYQVSLITIKKALSQLISEGYLYSRVGRGTFVGKRNLTPASSVTATRTIGLVLTDITEPFYSLIVREAEKVISHKGFHMLLSNTGNAEREEQQIQRFRDMGVSGLIIASIKHLYRASDAIRNLEEAKFPYVMISYVEDQDIRFVGTDYEMGGFIATEHLVRKGFRNIGYISAEEGNLVSELRRKGYRKALSHYKIDQKPEFEFHLEYHNDWNYYNSGQKLGRELGAKKDLPEAFFVYNDLAALGLIQGLQQAGRSVPEEVAIVGFDDIERANWAPTPLSTVNRSTDEIGRIAATQVLQQIEGEVDIPKRTIVKPKLVIRASCGTYPWYLKQNEETPSNYETYGN